jgi:hypothetical protein
MDYSSSVGNAAAGGLGIAYLACMGIFGLIALLLFVLNVWMLIDCAGRQEYEFPGSTGSSKTLWLVLLIAGLVVGFGWIVAIVYYFKVFKVIKRGTMAPPATPQYAPQAPAAYPPQAYMPPAPPAYQPPPAPPVYAPPAPPVAPAYEPPPAPPVYAPPVEPAAVPEPPAPPAPLAEPPAE